jgi:hypothetical protein
MKDAEGQARVTKLKRDELDDQLEHYMAGSADAEAEAAPAEAEPEAAS